MPTFARTGLLRLLAAFSLALLGLASSATAVPPARAPGPTLLIANVTLIDGTGAPARANQSVLIADGRILRVGPARGFRSAPGARIIDGRGKYLIPGLWNMHLHAGSHAGARAALPALLDAGVTGVRDMGAPLTDIVRLRDEIRDGTVFGPRLVIAGPLVQGPLPAAPPLIERVPTAQAADGIVARLRAAGVDFIKVGDALPADVFVALARAARRRGIPLAGHVPPTMRAAAAAGLGQRSIEHLGGRFFGVLIDASSDGDRFAALAVRFYDDSMAALGAGREPPFDSLRAPFLNPLLASFDERRAQRLYARFVQRGTWHCPTLVALPVIWEEYRDQLSPADRHAAATAIRLSYAVTRAMSRAGVGLLAGTDGGYDEGGAALHRELAALVEAGLTPMAALQTATRNPARFLGLGHRLGTIEPGKDADLVLLDADPLADIANIARVHATFVGGRPHLPRR